MSPRPAGQDPHPGVLADEPERWEVLASQDVYRGAAPFAVRHDEVAAPDGAESFSRVVLEHPGAVIVLALDEEDRAVVLRQYRHPAGTRFVELPAGLLDAPGEDPLEAAQRELLEEVSLVADHWEHLSSTYSSPGVSEELIHAYLATGLREVEGRGGFVPVHEEADMTVHRVPFAELLAGVRDGRLTDGPLVVAVLTHALHTRTDAPPGQV